MTDELEGYFYWTLAKPVGNRPPRRVTRWHIDPLCQYILGSTKLRGPVPIEIDPVNDPGFVVCSCFNRAGIPGVSVKTVSSGKFGPRAEPQQ